MLNDPQKTVSQTETIKDSLSGSRVPVTLDILLEMRFPDDVTISSDGKKVAFVVWENVPDEPKRRGRIWAPDGSRIAFISLEGEEPKNDPKVISPGRQRRLWTVRPDHTIPEPVVPDGITVWEYSWSPDSKQLALYYSTG